MKKLIILTILSSFSAFSQTSTYEFEGRQNPSVKKESLYYATSVTEILPQFWDKIGVPYYERKMLDEMLNYRKFFDSKHQKYFYLQESYDKLIECVFVEISTTIEGRELKAQSNSYQLTDLQKRVILAAEMGSDLNIRIKYKYKNPPKGDKSYIEKQIEGVAYVTIVPQIEAEFVGGFKQLTAYLKDNFINQIYDAKTRENIRRMEVKFAVNEKGQIVDVKLNSSSNNAKIDKLLLDAITQMPKWRPAKNWIGVNVKQEFRIPFGGC